MINNLYKLLENDFKNIDELINIKYDKYCEDFPLIIKKNIQKNSFSFRLH